MYIALECIPFQFIISVLDNLLCIETKYNYYQLSNNPNYIAMYNST